MIEAPRYSSLEEALTGLEFPDEIRETLALVSVPHIDYGGTERLGHLVVHQDLVADVREIFAELFELKFPIHKMVPISAYGWDDEASMTDNNTSAFNYRRIYGTNEVSNHSHGRAIDINPLHNPYIARDGSVHPKSGKYVPGAPGTFEKDSAAVQAFLSRGWIWGAQWPDRTDWQHFQKLA